MKKIKINKFIPLVVILFSTVFLISASDQYYFKLNKSFDIYGSIVKEISNNYVVEIDPEQLMRESINGMLSELDPYTIYYNENETEDLSLMSHGQYTGLGITVSNIDSMITIVGIHNGYPASENGLKIGDRIYKIDSTEVLHLDTKVLREYTKGEPGSVAKMVVIRKSGQDTIPLTITREKIKLDNVSYYGVLENKIGYIKLERFTGSSAEEVRKAIFELKEQASIEGLVLDLRDNPGGLLDAAVNIVEIFVPKGSPIVSTKGRGRRAEYTYVSDNEPIEPNLPLAVLINEFSASASEVVAGAIQDLDRGVIIGKRSYGKGLVQSVYEIPYQGSLKITTAKYYTPSGRSIQKVDYEKNLKNNNLKNDVTDSIFYTENGRKVYEHDGIMPDTVTGDRNYSAFTRDLVTSFMIFNFTTEYTDKFQMLPRNFLVDDKLLNNFKNYLRNKDYQFISPSVRKAEELKDVIKSEKNDVTLYKLNELISSLEVSIDENLKLHKDEIVPILEQEILNRYYNKKELISNVLKDDNTVNTAVDVLKGKKYKEILLSGSNQNIKNH